MRAALLYSAAGSLLLSTLTAVPDAEDRTGAAERRGTAVAAARAKAAGVDFGPCPDAQDLPGSMQCGTVSVPLDYAHPDGRRIELSVSRARATQKDPRNGERKVLRQGALVHNPGGPGATGLYFPLIGLLPEWKRIAAAYDLVGYAPRGVGRSAPLSCTDPKQFFTGPSQAPAHPSKAYKRERVAKAKAYARGCAERAGGALRHYHSLNNARDLDVLRAALGEERLTFMGSSYGTYFGALYATLFPAHVRRMVFDSVVHPGPERIWYRNNLAQSAAFEDRWQDVREWPGTTPSTGWAGRSERCCAVTSGRARSWPPSRRAGRSGRASCTGRSCRPATTTTSGRTARTRCRRTSRAMRSP